MKSARGRLLLFVWLFFLVVGCLIFVGVSPLPVDETPKVLGLTYILLGVGLAAIAEAIRSQDDRLAELERKLAARQPPAEPEQRG
jgi:hypothetical protein